MCKSPSGLRLMHLLIHVQERFWFTPHTPVIRVKEPFWFTPDAPVIHVQERFWFTPDVKLLQSTVAVVRNLTDIAPELRRSSARWRGLKHAAVGCPPETLYWLVSRLVQADTIGYMLVQFIHVCRFLTIYMNYRRMYEAQDVADEQNESLTGTGMG
jgi:hypothetical protein